MLADFHVHTKFSADSNAEPEDMIKEAVKKKMKAICITDHMDKDYFVDGEEWIFDTKDYFDHLKQLKEKYREKINLRIGIELGLQPHLQAFSKEIISAQEFDYVIGSVHAVGGRDPYYAEFYEDRTDEEAYREVLVETLENIKLIKDYDVLGHLDYVVRYGKHKEKEYSYKRFSDEIDAILKQIIHDGKGLELNTGGLKYGLPFAHPYPEVLKRYRELGGEIITVGSDAHRPEHVAYDFDKAKEILKTYNFKYCTEFCQRKPIFLRIL